MRNASLGAKCLFWLTILPIAPIILILEELSHLNIIKRFFIGYTNIPFYSTILESFMKQWLSRVVPVPIIGLISWSYQFLMIVWNVYFIYSLMKDPWFIAFGYNKRQVSELSYQNLRWRGKWIKNICVLVSWLLITRPHWL